MTAVNKKIEPKRNGASEGASASSSSDFTANGFADPAAFFEKWSAGANDWLGMFAKPGEIPGQADAARLGRQAVEAWVTAGAVVARGLQDLNHAWFAVAREMVDDSATCAKDLLGCTDLPEAIEVQSRAIQNSYEKLVAESRRASTASAKMAEEAWAPLSQYVSKSVTPPVPGPRTAAR